MAKKTVETVKNFRERVFLATLLTLERIRVEFIHAGSEISTLPGPIVAKRGDVYVCEDNHGYVLSFVGVTPMNVHYTYTENSHSSGYTNMDAGIHHGCEHRADCVVIPARSFELSMMDLDDEWGISHRNFSDADAAYAADRYTGTEDQDMIPEYDPPCEE